MSNTLGAWHRRKALKSCRLVMSAFVWKPAFVSPSQASSRAIAVIVRDPNGLDCGTVFKPKLQTDPNYVNDKFGWHEPSFQRGQLARQ